MEKDLFKPIKKYFETEGYVCDGEVKDIDMYMEKGSENLAVELKVSLDFKVVQQAALRQKVADTVYIGTFRPKNMNSTAFKDKLYLLKRLGIGLILVTKTTGAVNIVSEPVVSELSTFQTRSKRKRKEISKEFKNRKTKSNVGGVNKAKLITSYRESSLLVLDGLCSLGGEASGKAVKEASGIAGSTRIMYDNYYGWFEALGKGIYKISESGYDALEEFENVLGKLARPTSPKDI